MVRTGKITAFCAAAAVMAALTAAKRPSVLSQASGGLWELSGGPGELRETRQCIPDPSMLVQVEHRGSSCTRSVIRDLPNSAEIHYTCPSAGFGRTTVTLLTPRSLRIETQGISGGAPFNYVVQARRVGNC